MSGCLGDASCSLPRTDLSPVYLVVLLADVFVGFLRLFRLHTGCAHCTAFLHSRLNECVVEVSRLGPFHDGIPRDAIYFHLDPAEVG
eukprot:689573-Amphidinium_carterae.1